MISIAKPKPTTCWYCEKPRSAEAAPDGRAACAQCKTFMQQGVICIGVSVPLEQDTLIDKIYRDGNWVVLSREEYTRRFRVAEAPTQRFAFVTPDVWQKAALPRFRKHGASHMSDIPLSPGEEDWSKEEEVSDAEEETIADSSNAVG